MVEAQKQTSERSLPSRPSVINPRAFWALTVKPFLTQSYKNTRTFLLLIVHCKFASQSCTPQIVLTASMTTIRHPRGAFQALGKARRFSTSSTCASARPSNRPPPQSQPTTEVNKRDQSTAAALKPRPAPSPAFNRDNAQFQKDASQRSLFRPQEMDHTFVGKKGGEIFHEMMLRQGVKHVCMYCSARRP